MFIISYVCYVLVAVTYLKLLLCCV